MIFVDTNVLIDYLRGNNSPFDALLDSEEFATCGIVLAELIHGIKSDKEKIKITEALSDFQWIRIEEDLWLEIGENLNLIKKSGFTVPFQDAVIATLCIKSDIPLLSNDTHFENIAKALPKLQMYVHPPVKSKLP